VFRINPRNRQLWSLLWIVKLIAYFCFLCWNFNPWIIILLKLFNGTTLIISSFLSCQIISSSLISLRNHNLNLWLWLFLLLFSFCLIFSWLSPWSDLSCTLLFIYLTCVINSFIINTISLLEPLILIIYRFLWMTIYVVLILLLFRLTIFYHFWAIILINLPFFFILLLSLIIWISFWSFIWSFNLILSLFYHNRSRWWKITFLIPQHLRFHDFFLNFLNRWLQIILIFHLKLFYFSVMIALQRVYLWKCKNLGRFQSCS